MSKQEIMKNFKNALSTSIIVLRKAKDGTLSLEKKYIPVNDKSDKVYFRRRLEDTFFHIDPFQEMTSIEVRRVNDNHKYSYEVTVVVPA